MTRKSVEILGLPIISVTEGVELGVSKTLVIDGRKGDVAAITIEDEDWYRSVKLLPYPSVIAIGKDAITVTSSESILTLEEASDFEAMLDENVRIIGTKAITKNGTINGKVKEIFVDGDGVVTKIRVIAPDGAESEISADEIAFFGNQVTVIGEPGDGEARRREAELYAAMRVRRPEAAPAPEPEPMAEEVSFASEATETAAAEVKEESEEAPAAEIEIRPEMPDTEHEPELAEELTATAMPDPQPMQTSEPGIVPELTENITAESAPEIPDAEAVAAPQELDDTPAEETVPAPESAEAPEMMPETPKEETPETAEETEKEAAPMPTTSTSTDTEEIAEIESEPSRNEPEESLPEAPEEEIAESATELAEVPKPKTRRKAAAKPRKKAEPVSEPGDEGETESKAQPKTRRKTAAKPKKAAETEPEPAEGLVLELESEPETKKKPATRTRRKAAAEPETPEAAETATMNRQRRFLLGRKVARDIVTADGVMLAKAGDEITDELLQKASLAGKLIELSMNAQ